jgi:CBS domain containing-hemolysin-like protein
MIDEALFICVARSYHVGMGFWLYIALLVLLIATTGLYRAYTVVPEKELKRRARAGDEMAKALYRVAGYGVSVRFFFLLLIGLQAAWLFVWLGSDVPSWVALLVIASAIWLGIVWLPIAHVTRISSRIAALVAPPIAWLMNYLHPVISKLVTFVRRHRPVRLHTGLYEKQDLIDLLARQEVQADNRIQKAELAIAEHALQFGDKLIREKLVPRRVVKAVSISDAIGPVLMAELHKSGHSRFPVYDGKKDNIVGTLYLKDLVQTKSGGLVAKAMRPDACFIHEEQPLHDALLAVSKTHHHLLVVVNSFEEYVGIITLEDVLEEILGQPIVDEFDRYHDMRAVAARLAEPEHEEHQQEQEKLEEQASEVQDSVAKN